jgi:general secretion pathway protein G
MVFCALLILVFVFADWRPDIGRLREGRANVQIRSFLAALETYRADCGGYPTTAEGLNALKVNPGNPGWHGPYLSEDIPADPWGRPYLYRHAGARAESPEIISYGADGKPGGRNFDTDISSRALFVAVPETPSEARVRHIRTLTFLGICTAFLGCLFLSRLPVGPAPEMRTKH